MPTEELDTELTDDRSPSTLTTKGSMGRRRALRIALLVALSLLLAVLSYVAYYYTQNRRVPIVSVTSGIKKVEPPQYLYSFSGTGARAMTQPTGIAVIGNRVYITDYGMSNIRAYTTNGDPLFDFGAIKDGGRTKMGSPVHLAVGPDTTLWVTDRTLDAVYVFDQNGKFLRKFLPNGDASFKWSPLAIAFGSNGDLYVSDVRDTEKHQILVFGTDGKLKAQWGSTKQIANTQDAPGKFLFPNGISVEGTGAATFVYVSDGDNRRVQVFRADGTFVRIINSSGTPRGILFDAQNDYVMVVDALAHQVDIYSPEGRPLTSFGSRGTGPGQMNYPNDIAMGSNGRIYVADRVNNQVEVWGPLLGEIPGVTKITPSNAWVPFVLAALLLLPLILLARRKKQFLALPDFVEGMIALDAVESMDYGRYRWIMTEQDKVAYEGRVVGSVDLGVLLHGEPYSVSDAKAIQDKLGVTEEVARVLAIADRCHNLCTEDIDLARNAVRLGVDVYDRVTWLDRFGKKKR